MWWGLSLGSPKIEPKKVDLGSTSGKGRDREEGKANKKKKVLIQITTVGNGDQILL